MTQHTEAHDVLLPIGAVCKILARSRASIYRDIAAGHFPKPTRLSGSSRWRRSDVLRVLAGIHTSCRT
ncbi:MAG: AlpA family phage regulatory protein [Pseudomonadota bacterium]